MRILLLLLSLLLCAPSWANDAQSILKHRCTECHDLKGPAAQSLKELWSRKGPDLFYAGSKYKRQWLEQWLVNPRRLRPAGYHYVKNIKPAEKRDIIDKKRLQPHLSLSVDEAKKVADTLMNLKAAAGMVTKGDFKGGNISASFGEMVFDKFNGCTACHQIEPGYGGLSGPEVYTSARRLQEDYLISFIRNPQAWNPKSAMPNKHVAEPNIQKLVQYLKALAKENWNDKK
jgi:cbb3-type cytochrome oxidase cytochrome c subunit